MDFDGIETVDVNSLGGNDVVNVDDLARTTVRTVNHDEAAALGGSAPDTGSDQTIVNATNAKDTITAAGAANAASVSGLVATVNTRHADVASDALTINALGGDDRVDASTLGADTMKLTEDGGAGDDTLLGGRGNDVQIGGDNNDAIDGNQGNDTALMGAGDDRFTWDPGDGSDIVEGQAGATPWPSTEPTSPRRSTCRPTAGACGSSATSRTSRWTSTTSRGSTSTPSAAPTS